VVPKSQPAARTLEAPTTATVATRANTAKSFAIFIFCLLSKKLIITLLTIFLLGLIGALCFQLGFMELGSFFCVSACADIFGGPLLMKCFKS
jgi:hypothetical protein